jgi:hypothetical protein
VIAQLILVLGMFTACFAGMGCFFACLPLASCSLLAYSRCKWDNLKEQAGPVLCFSNFMGALVALLSFDVVLLPIPGCMYTITYAFYKCKAGW